MSMCSPRRTGILISNSPGDKNANHVFYYGITVLHDVRGKGICHPEAGGARPESMSVAEVMTSSSQHSSFFVRLKAVRRELTPFPQAAKESYIASQDATFDEHTSFDKEPSFEEHTSFDEPYYYSPRPKVCFRGWIRRKYYQYEVTWGPYVLTPGEKVLVNSMVAVMFCLILYGITKLVMVQLVAGTIVRLVIVRAACTGEGESTQG
jgi:Small subunit of serine palmitoyltransferase-like